MGSPITANSEMKTLALALVALAPFGLAFGAPQRRTRRPRPGQRQRPCQTPGLSSTGTTGCNDVRAEGAVPGLGFGGSARPLGKKKRSAQGPEAGADSYGYWGGSYRPNSYAYWGKKKRSAHEETAANPYAERQA